MKIPRRYAPYIFAALQVTITTAVATAVALWRRFETGVDFIAAWLPAWGAALAVMLPLVLLVAPLIQRSVMHFTVDTSA